MAATPQRGRSLADIEQAIRDHDVRYLRVEQPDLHGIPRSKIVPARRLAEIVGSGLNFPLPPLALDIQCEAVSGTGYLEERGFSDATLQSDLDSFVVLPWVPGTARIIADPFHASSGEPALAGSRHVPRPLLEQLSGLGFELLSGFEFEFYLLDRTRGEPPSAGVRQFASMTAGDAVVIRDILEAIEALGLSVTTANLEYGPSQFEINFSPAHGLAAADQAYTFKAAVKEIAAAHGRLASFMTKPAIDRSASGCHYNQSLWRDGVNVFADPTRRDGLSDIGRNYLAGQLHHAAAITALAAPTVNCAKRFRPHSFAPFQGDWAVDNRTVAFRVKGRGDASTHVESRLGGAAANPYLVLAASLAAGLDGIRGGLVPPAPLGHPDAPATWPPLPTSLEASLAALEADEAIATALGEEFIRVFLAVKRHEVGKARRAADDFDGPGFHDRIDPWERAEYLELL